MVVSSDGFTFLESGPTTKQVRDLLGDPGRLLFRGSAGRAAEHLEVLCPENPGETAPVQYVDVGAGPFPVQGPVAIVAQTQQGFSTVFTREMLESIALEERSSVPSPVLTIRKLPTSIIAHRDERSFRRVKVALLLLVVFAGWWVWRSKSMEQPKSLVGTWGFAHVTARGWEQADTLRLFPDGRAVRRSRATWHGEPTEVGRQIGADLDDLDLSGVYTWGIRRPPFKPVELCLRAKGDSPPMGCAPVEIGAREVVWGKAHFARQ